MEIGNMPLCFCLPRLRLPPALHWRLRRLCSSAPAQIFKTVSLGLGLYVTDVVTDVLAAVRLYNLGHDVKR